MLITKYKPEPFTDRWKVKKILQKSHSPSTTSKEKNSLKKFFTFRIALFFLAGLERRKLQIIDARTNIVACKTEKGEE